MINFFKRKKPTANRPPQLSDLNQEPLSEGDTVESLRYELGVCRVILTDKGIAYESLEDGRQVGWHLMVDASTDLQKVKKIIPPGKS